MPTPRLTRPQRGARAEGGCPTQTDAASTLRRARQRPFQPIQAPRYRWRPCQRSTTPLPPTIDAPGRAEALAALCERHGVAWLAVFGSATTDAFDPTRSDIDLLVQFHPGASDYFAFRDELVALFGREVDLVMWSAVRNPYFRENATETSWPIYGSVRL